MAEADRVLAVEEQRGPHAATAFAASRARRRRAARAGGRAGRAGTRLTAGSATRRAAHAAVCQRSAARSGGVAVAAQQRAERAVRRRAAREQRRRAPARGRPPPGRRPGPRGRAARRVPSAVSSALRRFASPCRQTGSRARRPRSSSRASSRCAAGRDVGPGAGDRPRRRWRGARGRGGRSARSGERREPRAARASAAPSAASRAGAARRGRAARPSSGSSSEDAGAGRAARAARGRRCARRSRRRGARRRRRVHLGVGEHVAGRVEALGGGGLLGRVGHEVGASRPRRARGSTAARSVRACGRAGTDRARRRPRGAATPSRLAGAGGDAASPSQR